MFECRHESNVQTWRPFIWNWLDTPITINGKVVTYVFYGHLSSVVNIIPNDGQHSMHVEQGQPIGYSGVGNASPHLHLTLYETRGGTAIWWNPLGKQ